MECCSPPHVCPPGSYTPRFWISLTGLTWHDDAGDHSFSSGDILCCEFPGYDYEGENTTTGTYPRIVGGLGGSSPSSDTFFCNWGVSNRKLYVDGGNIRCALSGTLYDWDATTELVMDHNTIISGTATVGVPAFFYYDDHVGTVTVTSYGEVRIRPY